MSNSATTVRDALREYDFSDGWIDEVRIRSDGVALLFRDWRERLLQLQFTGVVLLKSYEFGGEVTEVQASALAAEIEEAIAMIEGNGGAHEGYPGLTYVCFVGDAPMVGLVCGAAQIEVMPG